MENFEGRVKRVVAAHLGIPLEDVHNTSRLVEDLGADELDILKIGVALAKEFELEIPEADAKRFLTVQAAIDYMVAGFSQS